MKQLRVALVGYGKMGRAIEALAPERGVEIVARITSQNVEVLQTLSPERVDVAIEFSRPDTCLLNIRQLLANGLPVIIGTTGWDSQRLEIDILAKEKGIPCVWAANFSIGVQLLFKINELLAKWMNQYPEYDPFIEERHHRHKMDAPGGTALRLAEQVLSGLDRKSVIASNQELMHRAPLPEELSVAFTRAGEIRGTHTVSYVSAVDKIELKHEAYSRDGFALGALFAAQQIGSLPPGLHDFATLI